MKLPISALRRLIRSAIFEAKKPKDEDDVDIMDVPDVRQSTRYTCGASALEAVLLYFGVEKIEDDLAEELDTTSEDGTTAEDLVRVAKAHGLKAEKRENMTLDDISKCMSEEHPVIVAIQAWPSDGDKDLSKTYGDGHYVVAIGMDDENVYFEEPSLLGSRGVLTHKDFLERWHDKEEDGDRVQHLGIVFGGKAPDPPEDFSYIE